MATSTVGSIFTSSPQYLPSTRSVACSSASPSVSSSLASSFTGTSLQRSFPKKKKKKLKNMYVLVGRCLNSGGLLYIGKRMNGLPPMSGEKLKVFYNPTANKLVPNEEFGIGFNGGFNQPFMCGGEPREMLKKTRGQNDAPFYTIQICIPKHAVNLIFSFTNGVDWDGPYRLQFQVPKGWRNKPIDFFNKGLAEELSNEGACDRVIFPDTDIVVDRCAMIGNLIVEGGDRCDLNLVPGCMDPNALEYNPLANVDDGSCPIELDSEV
ncbi:hypothetical protein QYF36_012331 [Acer negundo]|nr:hypothetical protein QYF36_012331 [Acer negundo]